MDLHMYISVMNGGKFPQPLNRSYVAPLELSWLTWSERVNNSPTSMPCFPLIIRTACHVLDPKFVDPGLFHIACVTYPSICRIYLTGRSTWRSTSGLQEANDSTFVRWRIAQCMPSYSLRRYFSSCGYGVNLHNVGLFPLFTI